MAQALVNTYYRGGQKWDQLHPRVLEALGEEKACAYTHASNGECDLNYQFVSLNPEGTKLFLTIGNSRDDKKVPVVRIEDDLSFTGRQTGTVTYVGADGTRLIRKVFRNGLQQLEYKLPGSAN